MRNLFSFMIFFLAACVCTISYAEENSIQDVDTPPRVVKAVRPYYPLKTTGGKVVLRFIVTKDGEVRDPEVFSSVPKGIFDESALGAIKKYKFQPATNNGKPVDCIVKLPIEFGILGVKTFYDAYKENDKGVKYFKTGEYDKAIKAFTDAIEMKRNYSPGYSGRGMTYLELGEYKKAVSNLDRAIFLSPEKSKNYRLRGYAHKKLEEYKKALKDYGNAIKREPDVKEDYYNRGDVLQKLGRDREAIEDYTKAIELDGSYIEAYYNRAVSYDNLKDNDNMCLDLEKACELGDCGGIDQAKKAEKCSGNRK